MGEEGYPMHLDAQGKVTEDQGGRQGARRKVSE